MSLFYQHPYEGSSFQPEWKPETLKWLRRPNLAQPPPHYFSGPSSLTPLPVLRPALLVSLPSTDVNRQPPPSGPPTCHSARGSRLSLSFRSLLKGHFRNEARPSPLDLTSQTPRPDTQSPWLFLHSTSMASHTKRDKTLLVYFLSHSRITLRVRHFCFTGHILASETVPTQKNIYWKMQKTLISTCKNAWGFLWVVPSKVFITNSVILVEFFPNLAHHQTGPQKLQNCRNLGQHYWIGTCEWDQALWKAAQVPLMNCCFTWNKSIWN